MFSLISNKGRHLIFTQASILLCQSGHPFGGTGLANGKPHMIYSTNNARIDLLDLTLANLSQSGTIELQYLLAANRTTISGTLIARDCNTVEDTTHCTLVLFDNRELFHFLFLSFSGYLGGFYFVNRIELFKRKISVLQHTSNVQIIPIMRTLGHRPNDIPIVLSPTLHLFLSFFSTILPNFSAAATLTLRGSWIFLLLSSFSILQRMQRNRQPIHHGCPYGNRIHHPNRMDGMRKYGKPDRLGG